MKKSIYLLPKILEKKYGLKDVIFLEKANGYSAQNYVIQANSELFILKEFRSFNEIEILRIENISFFLSEKKIPVILPIKTRDLTFHFKNNQHYYAIFPKVKGNVLHEPSFTTKALDEAAILLNKLHTCTDKCYLNLNVAKSFTKVDFNSNSDKIFALLEEQPISGSIYQLIKDLIGIKHKLFMQIINHYNFDKFLSKHDFVHGDYHNENILFDNNQHIIHLLDFEEVHYGNKLEDVAGFILISCFSSGFKKMNFSNACQFLKTYIKIDDTTHEEIQEAIYYLIGKFSNSFFLEKMFFKTKDPLYVLLFERDLKKYQYFLNHLLNFTDSLMEGL